MTSKADSHQWFLLLCSEGCAFKDGGGVEWGLGCRGRSLLALLHQLVTDHRHVMLPGPQQPPAALEI